MTVAIIGVGQIGSNLALDLTDDRSSLDEQLLIAARSIESAQRLVDTLPLGPRTSGHDRGSDHHGGHDRSRGLA